MGALVAVLQFVALVLIIMNVFFVYKEKTHAALICADITVILYIIAFIIVRMQLGV